MWRDAMRDADEAEWTPMGGADGRDVQGGTLAWALSMGARSFMDKFSLVPWGWVVYGRAGGLGSVLG